MSEHEGQEPVAGGVLAAELRSLAEVFRSPDLRRLELAWLATSFGVWGSALVLAIYAYEKGGASAVGIMALVRTLPGGPVAPLVTYMADRVSRRSVLLVSNVVRTALLAGIALCASAGASLGLVYALVALIAIASPAYRPSQSALFPILSRAPSELSSANVAATVLLNLGFLAGSLAGGALLTVMDFDVVFGLLAAVFAASLVPLLRIARDTPPPPDPDARPARELAEGFALVRRDPEVRLLVAVGGAAMMLLGAIDVLVVVSALGFLGLGESGAGYLSAAMGAGAVVGGFAVLELVGRGRLGTCAVLGALMSGVAAVTIGVVPAVAIVVLALVVVGAGDAFVDVGVSTLLQRLTPDRVLSRVFGVVEAQSVVVLATGSVVTGFLVDAIGARATFVGVGILLPACVLLARGRLMAYESGAPVAEREYGLLRRNPIFSALPVASVERLARNLVEVRPADDAFVFRQGDPGELFYLIAEGEVDVLVDDVHVDTLGPGQGFGEIALLRDVPRQASIRTRTGVVLLALESRPFIAAASGAGASLGGARAQAPAPAAQPVSPQR